MKGTLLTAVLSLLAMAGPASAVITIDFTTGNAGAGGTITTNGSNASGSGIGVGILTVTGTGGAADGTYDTSGTANDLFFSNGSASLSFDTVAGTISIVGDICPKGQPGCAAGAALVPNTTLLSGTFNSFNVSANGFLVNVTGTGPDTKSPLLLQALGIPVSTQFVFFALNIAGVGTGGHTYTANSSDIENQAVPEPAAIILLGTVMFGVMGLVRRRTRAA